MSPWLDRKHFQPCYLKWWLKNARIGQASCRNFFLIQDIYHIHTYIHLSWCFLCLDSVTKWHWFSRYLLYFLALLLKAKPSLSGRDEQRSTHFFGMKRCLLMFFIKCRLFSSKYTTYEYKKKSTFKWFYLSIQYHIG